MKKPYTGATHAHHLLQQVTPVCPVCHERADGAGGGDEAPKAHDCSICWYCQSVLEFYNVPGGLALRQLHPDEIAALPDPLRTELLAIRDSMIRYRRDHGL